MMIMMMTTARTMILVMMIQMNKMKIKAQRRKSARKNPRISLIIKEKQKRNTIKRQRVALEFLGSIRRRNKE